MATPASLPQGSERFRAPAGARVTSHLLVHARAGARANGEAGPQGRRAGCPESRRSNQEEATPRWHALRASCPTGAQKQPTQPQSQHSAPAPLFMQGGETASSRNSTFAPASGAQDARLLCRGPSAAVSRGRSGRTAGVAREGNAFSTGQEPGRKARPRLTDFPAMDGRKAPPRGGLLFWPLFSWPRKRKVARAAAAVRNRFLTRAIAPPHPQEARQP